MIRDATKDDMAKILQIAMKFNDLYYTVPLNPVKFVDGIEFMIDHEDSVVLIGNSGAIVGTFAEDPFRDWLSLVELGWYSEGGEGIKLLQEFERRGAHADEVRMSTLSTSPKVAEKLLIRRGYKLVEQSYTLTK